MVLKRNAWVGRSFGRLKVIDLKRYEGAGTVIECQCSCGVIILARSHNLIRGSTASCGCLALEARTTHGKTDSRVYVIWRGMKSRCKPNANDRANYYDRGIRVCRRWQKFENFYADMGDPPDGLTLERKNNSKGYNPDNCKWATYTEQLNNRRNNHVITAFGKTQTLTMWCRETGLPLNTLKNRIVRASMSPEDALRAPLYAKQRASTA